MDAITRQPEPTETDPSPGWIAAARDGCEQSFAALYHRHSPRLVPLLWRLAGGDAGRAEDWLQEVFLRVWRRLDQLDDPARFPGWLKRMAINHALNDLGRGQLNIASECITLQPAPEPPWPAADVDLERAIAALPGRAREVLVLACLEGYSHAEIAELMAIDDGTSRGQLHRARQLLQETLS